jgi:hypothetical protein
MARPKVVTKVAEQEERLDNFMEEVTERVAQIEKN